MFRNSDQERIKTMDFTLNEELQGIKEVVSEFAASKIAPMAAVWDKDHDARLSRELNKEMGDLGILGLVTPEEYGGSNMGYMALVVAEEAMVYNSRCGISSSFVSAPNCAVGAPFLHYGTEEQKQRYLTGIASGDLQGAAAITEPAGSSAVSSMKTVAVEDGDDYIINGSKIFITRADTSDFVLTLANTDEGSVCLIVDAGTPGMEIGKSEDKMGLRGLGLNPVFYQDCRVPKTQLLGKVGQGLEVMIDSLYHVRTCVGAASVGLAQAAIELARDYAKTRILHGKALSSFQNTQFVLAEAQTKVDAARLLVWRSADALDKGTFEYYMASEAKMYASEVCGEVIDKCLQVFGGYGYCSEYDIERMYRDCRVWRILDGASEIHKRLISKYMGVR